LGDGAGEPFPAGTVSGSRRALFPKMAAVDQYLMTGRSAEIAMARSAAPHRFQPMPKSWSSGGMATKLSSRARMVFVCLVERSWMSRFDFAQFWNPKMRAQSL